MWSVRVCRDRIANKSKELVGKASPKFFIIRVLFFDFIS